MWCALLFFLMVMCKPAMVLSAGETLPVFSTDEAAHAWLKTKSPWYERMSTEVQQRGGVTFGVLEPERGSQGLVESREGRRHILLSSALKGAARLSILIYELTNVYQETAHAEVDRRAHEGSIRSAEEFALLHELIEYDGLRYHRFVLAELDAVLEGGIPRDMLNWINPKLTTLASYELPLAYVYVKTQAENGHSAHYMKAYEGLRAASARSGMSK